LGKFAFGVDFGASSGGEEQPLTEAFTCILKRMVQFARNPLLFKSRFYFTAENRRYAQALNVVNETVRSAIEQRLASGVWGEDLLGVLLEAESDSAKKKVDRELILENLKTVLFAGHDTTASALSFMLYLLAAHPENQQELVCEFAKLGHGAPTLEALEALPHLDAVIKETLRLYPSAGFTREPLQDVDLGGHIVPKGAQMFFFPYLIHRDERLFKDPDTFKPERWRAASASPESQGWIPFSLGARNCVGLKLALLELKATAHALLSKYVIKLPEGAVKPEVVLYMTLVPNAVDLLFEPRKSSSPEQANG
jgi:cytochrome P450